MNLGYCWNLTNLTKTIDKLKSLRILILFGCSKLEKLPEELGHIALSPYLFMDVKEWYLSHGVQFSLHGFVQEK